MDHVRVGVEEGVAIARMNAFFLLQVDTAGPGHGWLVGAEVSI